MKQLLTDNKKWDELGAKEKSQIILASILIGAAIILIFLCFLITLEVGGTVLAAAAEFLVTACTLLGLTLMVRTSLIDIQTKVQELIDDKTKDIDKE
jgi:hypothetical protein